MNKTEIIEHIKAFKSFSACKEFISSYQNNFNIIENALTYISSYSKQKAEEVAKQLNLPRFAIKEVDLMSQINNAGINLEQTHNLELTLIGISYSIAKCYAEQLLEFSNTFKKSLELISLIKNASQNSMRKGYSFEGFLHTTNFSNFISILKCGFLTSRDEAIKSHLLKPENDVANTGVIIGTTEEITQKTRFYYYFQTPTNYTANYKNPVIMVFDEYLLLDEKNAYFAEQCAGKRTTHLTKNIEDAMRFNWRAIFERGYYSHSCLHDPANDEVTIEERNNITAYRNAEFLYDGRVSIKKIVKVYFSTKEDYLKAIKICRGTSFEYIIEKFQEYNKNDNWRFYG